jgi:hypothetical protein
VKKEIQFSPGAAKYFACFKTNFLQSVIYWNEQAGTLLSRLLSLLNSPTNSANINGLVCLFVYFRINERPNQKYHLFFQAQDIYNFVDATCDRYFFSPRPASDDVHRIGPGANFAFLLLRINTDLIQICQHSKLSHRLAALLLVRLCGGWSPERKHGLISAGIKQRERKGTKGNQRNLWPPKHLKWAINGDLAIHEPLMGHKLSAGLFFHFTSPSFSTYPLIACNCQVIYSRRMRRKCWYNYIWKAFIVRLHTNRFNCQSFIYQVIPYFLLCYYIRYQA